MTFIEVKGLYKKKRGTVNDLERLNVFTETTIEPLREITKRTQLRYLA